MFLKHGQRQRGDKAMDNAVGYIRVSTDTQAEKGMGLEIQKESIQKYTKGLKLNLAKIYEDAGISGASLERPALLELLADAKRGLFKKAIILRLDRLARDLFGQLFIEKELEVAGIELISISEPDLGKNDPNSKLFRQIKGAFAQYEKSIITIRLKTGRLMKVKNGGFPGGNMSLGYKLIKGNLKKVEHEIEIVKRIKTLRRGRNKMSMWKIAEILNQENVPTKRGGKWYAGTIRKVLNNKLYDGILKYGEAQSVCESLKI